MTLANHENNNSLGAHSEGGPSRSPILTTLEKDLAPQVSDLEAEILGIYGLRKIVRNLQLAQVEGQSEELGLNMKLFGIQHSRMRSLMGLDLAEIDVKVAEEDSEIPEDKKRKRRESLETQIVRANQAIFHPGEKQPEIPEENLIQDIPQLRASLRSLIIVDADKFPGTEILPPARFAPKTIHDRAELSGLIEQATSINHDIGNELMLLQYYAKKPSSPEFSDRLPRFDVLLEHVAGSLIEGGEALREDFSVKEIVEIMKGRLQALEEMGIAHIIPESLPDDLGNLVIEWSVADIQRLVNNMVVNLGRKQDSHKSQDPTLTLIIERSTPKTVDFVNRDNIGGVDNPQIAKTHKFIRGETTWGVGTGMAGMSEIIDTVYHGNLSIHEVPITETKQEQKL